MAKQTQIFYKSIYLCVYKAVNSRGYILHKVGYKKGRRKHNYDIYKKNPPLIPKQVVNVIDLGYLGVETDFPDNYLCLTVQKEKKSRIISRNIDYNIIHSKNKIVIKSILYL